MNLTPRYLLAAVLVVALGSGVACGMLPERQGPRAAGAAAAAASASAVTVRDRSGAAVAGEKAVLQQLKTEGRPDLAEHHLRVLASSGDVDLYRNNTTRLLVDGPATIAAMKAAISRARGRVLLESYIVEDSTVASDLGELLMRKAKEGVSVALMYDAVGSIGATDAYFKTLAQGGVAVCKFNPVNPLERPGYWGINHRNHRKVLVVDEEAAFTGGINISRTYASGSRGGSAGGGSSMSGSKASDEELLKSGWRDTHIELRGPAVTAFARGFTELWLAQGCPGGAQKLGRAAPLLAAAPGQRVVKVLQSDPGDATNRIYTSLLAAMDAAQRSIHLTMAYFAPGQDMVDALSDAARRGVDVTLILPGRSDFSLILHAGRSYYRQMLDAGVRIHEIDDAVLHAKTAVIDGVFATVGSSNLDWRSFVANNEVNVIVLGDDFARELEALFQRDLARGRAIDAATWAKRGVSQRVMEQIGRLAERLL